MTAPIELDKLMKRIPKELRDPLMDLYRLTYKEAYDNGKMDAKEKCGCLDV